MFINKRIVLIGIAALAIISFASCSKKDDVSNDELEKTESVAEEFSPSDTLSKMNVYDSEISVLDNLEEITEIGQIVKLGSYEQMNDGDMPEPIEWIVMDINDGKALLLSRYVLAAQPYSTVSAEVSWETSSVREWLNSEFLDTAFSENEKGRVQISPVNNTDDGGMNTADSVFLLSEKEAKNYFGTDDSRAAKATAYAAVSVYTLKGFTEDKELYNGNCRWWLRTPQNDETGLAKEVRAIGDILSKGQDVTNTDIGVRPAMWVSIK